MNEEKKKQKGKGLDRFLNGIERVGNKMPDPITLFLWLALIVVVISWICAKSGVRCLNPATNEYVEAENLLSWYGLKYLWSNVVTNFTGFAPLGMVLVSLIGTGVAERTGFLTTLMTRWLGNAKGWVVTLIIMFAGINLSVSGDAGFIIMPPLSAMLFLSIGRSPLLGLYAGYASVTGGMCACLSLGVADALAYGFTESAAQMIDPSYSASIAINYYFMIASTIVLTLVGTWVVEKVLAPRYAVTPEKLAQYEYDPSVANVTPVQKKGLRVAGIVFLVFALFIVLMSVPIFGETAIFADETGSITNGAAPFTKGIVFTASLALFFPGLAYGIVTGRYHKDTDVWADVIGCFSDMGSYVFMCFCISIFTSFFSVSKLGTCLAIGSADFLKNIGFTGIPLMLGLLLISCILNLFIGSASAKWAILAPIFVPMMMLMGYDPALTQTIYRIGDSVSNPISPLFTYMPILIGYARKYEKDSGMGTLIAGMLPISTGYLVAWIAMLIIWVEFNIPLGPGGFIFLG